MSSSDSEDDLISYGTPLDPLEEDETPSKRPRLLEDQVVKDKQGRRRFHGAFTGGFSAGFFNTVGSLEGWAPSSFKSSKSNKQGIFQQRPEDFMDDEDLSEFGIAPIVLKAKQDYTMENKKEASTFSEFSTLGNYVLQNLLKPVRETIGIQLLKKMGWKPGQGVGPRLNKKEKTDTFKMRQKTYGCQLPPGTLEEREEIDQNSDPEWDDIEFAPSDYEPFLCEARNNFYGLGYEGLDKRPILSGNPSDVDNKIKKKNKKFGFGSQAFGVGAFEEEDEDIYARDDMSRYDFCLGSDQLEDVNKSSEKNYLSQNDVLEGFMLESKRRVRKHYPLPVLPADFKPYHKIHHSRFDLPSPDDKEKTQKGVKVSSEDRRKLLKEPSEEMKETRKLQESSAKELISNVKISENKFKPFSSNPEKQERYENYLKLIKIGKRELLIDLQPLSMTEWDKQREKVEFEKAAALFKPLSGGMEDRFLTASQPDDLTDPLAVVEKYIDDNDDRKRAAKMNMFGPLTRSTEEWIPTSLLCKRFNIPEPRKKHDQSTEKKIGKSYFNLFDSVQALKESIEKSENFEDRENLPHERANEEKPEKPEKLQSKDENLPDTQDKTDLFKAIFLASDDDEEKNCEEEIEVESPKEAPHSKSSGAGESAHDDLLYEEKLINSKRNLSPPRGIFKNIDLDLLSGKKMVDKTGAEFQKNRKIELEIETADKNFLHSNLVYGPKIPEKVGCKTGFVADEHLRNDGVWVEKKTHDEKKHKKKDKKNKKSHKSKHKHKKHKR